MEDVGVQYLCVSCNKIIKINYRTVEYSISIIDMYQYRLAMYRFREVDPDPDLDPNHYYEYIIGLCPKCYTLALKNKRAEIEESVQQLTAMLNQTAKELSIEMNTMFQDFIARNLSNLSLDDIRIALGQDFNYLYSSTSVFAKKPFSPDKRVRQEQIIKKHISAIEHYLVRKASKDSIFTLIIDLNQEGYVRNRIELILLLEKDATNFYAIQMISEDGWTFPQERHVNDSEKILPEKLFYTYDESIFNMLNPLKFDEIINSARLENGKVFKKVLDIVHEHENQ